MKYPEIEVLSGINKKPQRIFIHTIVSYHPTGSDGTHFNMLNGHEYVAEESFETVIKLIQQAQEQ